MLRVKDRAKPKLPPVEPGVYISVCVGVIDLGEQLCEYKNKKTGYQPKVQFVWELVGETVEVDGETKPRQLSRIFPQKKPVHVFLPYPPVKRGT